jgi:integrase/recombinase XerD
MTPLRKEMIDWMFRRGFSPRTVETYVKAAVKFAQHYGKSPALLTEQDIVAYMDYLCQDRQLSQSSLNGAYSGIKVLWENILDRPWPNRLLPRSRRAKTLPEVLSRAEVQDILNALDNTKHRVMLRLMYATGLRVGELVELKPEHIDSQRMVIRVQRGKGKKDRYALLSEALLAELRLYWTIYRPKVYLFEGAIAGTPISIRTVQKVFQNACERCLIKRKVGVHVLRHCFATHLLERGVDPFVLKTLMGHTQMSTTARYVHIEHTHLHQVPNLLQA